MYNSKRWEQHERAIKRCGISLSPDEKRKRTQAFLDKFGPILLDCGFVKARGYYWRLQSHDYVQYVGLKNARGIPAMHYIACGSEWGLSRIAEGIMIPSVFAPQFWYSTPTFSGETLQRFVGACNRAESIGYGLFDEVDDFTEGLELEYERFVSDALPQLNHVSTVEDYYCSISDYVSRTRCAGILACIMTDRCTEALQLLESLTPISIDGNNSVLHQEQKALLHQYLMAHDEVATNNIVALCKAALYKDLAKINKKLVSKFTT